MKKTWKPMVAGVLVIVVGCYMIAFLAPVLFIGGGMYPAQWKVRLFSVLSLALVILGLIAVISGIFSCMRKLWRFAIAGSSCATLAGLIITALDKMILSVGLQDGVTLVIELTPTFLTIPASVLLVLSKKEFTSSAKPDQPTPD